MFYTYVIQSKSTNRLYIGHTNNLDKRLSRHNNNLNLATKNRGPWTLIFSQAFTTRAEAVSLERKLKAFKNPEKVREWIKRHSG